MDGSLTKEISDRVQFIYSSLRIPDFRERFVDGLIKLIELVERPRSSAEFFFGNCNYLRAGRKPTADACHRGFSIE